MLAEGRGTREWTEVVKGGGGGGRDEAGRCEIPEMTEAEKKKKAWERKEEERIRLKQGDDPLELYIPSPGGYRWEVREIPGAKKSESTGTGWKVRFWTPEGCTAALAERRWTKGVTVRREWKWNGGGRRRPGTANRGYQAARRFDGQHVHAQGGSNKR